MPSSEFPGFHRLFDDLLRFSLSRRVPFHDAEDLVGSTIESALKHFDAAKGEFRALCFTTLSNLMKNYWRDRKPGIPNPDGIELTDPDWEREFAWYRSEEEKAMLEAIMEELTEEERKFLVKLRDVYEELEDRAVSEASRQLGLQPQKGWDIFRRIQRKAQRFQPSVEYLSRIESELTTAKPAIEAEETIRYRRMVAAPALSSEVRVLANFTAGSAAFERILKELPKNAVNRIESFLS